MNKGYFRNGGFKNKIASYALWIEDATLNVLTPGCNLIRTIYKYRVLENKVCSTAEDVGQTENRSVINLCLILLP